MDPIAFSIGGFQVHWYGIFAAAGCLIGLWTAERRGRLGGLKTMATFDLGPWLIVGALLGARLLFVTTHPEHFQDKGWFEWFNIREGGLVWYGGLLGAMAATSLYVYLKKISLWQLADALAPSIPLGHAFGRLGCFLTGCCYGSPSDAPWAVQYPEAHATHPEWVHPTQLYSAGVNFGLYLGLAYFYRRKAFDGQIFALYLSSYAVLRLVVEAYRGDYPSPGPLTPGQFVSLLILPVALGLYYWRHRSRKPAKAATGS